MMHPEDDIELDELIKSCEKGIEQTKVNHQKAEHDVEVFKKRLESFQTPKEYIELFDSFFLVIKRIGKNTEDIMELQLNMLKFMRKVNKEIDYLSGTVAGLNKYK